MALFPFRSNAIDCNGAPIEENNARGVGPN